MTSQMIVCPKCEKEMPRDINNCWYCGLNLHPKLEKKSPDESQEGRNPTFLDREQKTPKMEEVKWK